MTGLLEIREQIKRIFVRFEIYITPVIKFVLMFITLSLINGKLGYMSRLNSATMVLLVSLVSAILPYNFMLLASAAFVILHLYAFSLECSVVVLMVFILMFLLYFRFASGDGIFVMLTPVCCMLNIPLVIPVSAGLTRGPASAVSVCCGMLINSIMDHISENETAITSMDAENAVQKYRLMVDGIIYNKPMMVLVVSMGITVVAVYIIRRLPIDHSWTAAIVTGLILPIVLMLMGDLLVDSGINVLPWFLGAIVAFFILMILQFFVFSVDYQRTERVQFEDDEYYYYVKAVPKMTVSRADKTVKKITRGGSAGSKRGEHGSGRLNGQDYSYRDYAGRDEGSDRDRMSLGRSGARRSGSRSYR